MSEDKHFRRALVLGLVISALLIGVGFWQSITMGIVCLVGCGALLAIFCLYTRNQTREIRRLSDYLTTLVNGTAPLLVPANNQEGELSLLENNIYKTARKLQTQAELMQKDKTYLADALADISHQLKSPYHLHDGDDGSAAGRRSTRRKAAGIPKGYFRPAGKNAVDDHLSAEDQQI